MSQPLHSSFESRHLLSNNRFERTGTQRATERFHFLDSAQNAPTQLESLYNGSEATTLAFGALHLKHIDTYVVGTSLRR